ncbi:MAG TPA: hypothetical protein VJX67_25615, partial [Blastocatellia bacterium]|nr:hypothetical protein [Blastocatellia bacterium]
AATRSDDETSAWFKNQIVHVANQLAYYADTRSYRAWVRLKIKEDRQAEIVISFHALGVVSLGVMAVSAFLEYRDRAEDGAATLDGPHPLSREVFQFSYREREHEIKKRFERWLNDALVAGLDQWRRQL